MKDLYRHIKETMVYTDGTGRLYSPITEDMFDFTDIDEVFTNVDGGFAVSFRGINGFLPPSFFDPEARIKVRNIAKIRRSALWKTLNGSDNKGIN